MASEEKTASGGAQDGDMPEPERRELHAPDPALKDAEIEPGPPAAFFESFAKKHPPHYLSANFRIISRGLFVREDAVSPMVESYQTWLREVRTGGEKSAAKCKRRLFGSEDPELFYVLDGNVCIPGFLIAGVKLDAHKVRIPHSASDTLATSNYLHPRDPKLSALANVKSSMKTHEGLVLHLTAGQRTIHLSSSMITRFAESIRSNDVLLKALPQFGGPLRECIEPMAIAFAQARHIPNRRKLLVPERIKAARNAEFIAFRSLIILLNEQGLFLDCFDSRGKSMRALLSGELKTIRGPGKPPLIFETPPKRSRFLGKLYVQRHSYLVTPLAFYSFLSRVPRSISLRKTIPSRYTVSDCVLALHDLIKNSNPIDEKLVRGVLGKQRFENARYLVSSSWLFVITEGTVLSAALELPRSLRLTAGPERKPRR